MKSRIEPQLRSATKDDWPFITSTWFRSYTKAKRPTQQQFPAFREAMSTAMPLIASASDVVVAYLPEAPTEILGYAITQGDVLHYVYVKKDYRRHGVATTLVPHGTVREYTFKGQSEFNRWREHAHPAATFNQHLVPVIVTRQAHRIVAADNAAGRNEAVNLDEPRSIVL